MNNGEWKPTIWLNKILDKKIDGAVDEIQKKLTETTSFVENLFASSADVNFTSQDLLNGKTAFNGTAVITGTMPDNSDATVTAPTVVEDNENVYFSIPESGYYNKNSKVKSNRSNIKSVIKLGTGRSFDLKKLCPDVDYTKLTVDNFIVGASNVPASSADNYTPEAPSWMWTAVQLSSMTQITKSYDNTTGILTLGGGSITARGYTHGNDSTVTNAYCTSNAELFAYLKL